MDGAVLNEPSKQPSFSEVFREQCPIYMSFGMTYDEFWNGTPRIAEAYRKKHTLDQDRMNFELWLGGYYHYIAVGTALSNAFKEKGRKADDYIKEPIPIRKKTQAELDAEQERKNAELIKKLNAWQQGWVAKHSGEMNG